MIEMQGAVAIPEVDIEVPEDGEFRGVSAVGLGVGDDVGAAVGADATQAEGARLSCKCDWKDMLLETQSINRL
jgi:hypothetical protein